LVAAVFHFDYFFVEVDYPAVKQAYCSHCDPSFRVRVCCFIPHRAGYSCQGGARRQEKDGPAGKLAESMR
jgi:hypothetical protein